MSRRVARVDLLFDWRFATDTTGGFLAPLKDWLAPAIVIGLLGALIGAAVAYLMGRRSLKQQRELFEEEWSRRRQHEAAEKQAAEERAERLQTEAESTEESRYLAGVIGRHRFLPITGLRTRAPVEVEVERVFVSLPRDPGPPYGKAHGYYKKRGQKNKGSQLVIGDDEFADWVGVRVLSKAYGIEPMAVLDARRSGVSLGAFAHKQKGLAANHKQEKGRQDRHPSQKDKRRSKGGQP